MLTFPSSPTWTDVLGGKHFRSDCGRYKVLDVGTGRWYAHKRKKGGKKPKYIGLDCLAHDSRLDAIAACMADVKERKRG